jgi:hypothetical protein
MSKTTTDIAGRTPKGPEAECQSDLEIPELQAHNYGQANRNTDEDGPGEAGTFQELLQFLKILGNKKAYSIQNSNGLT